MNWIEVNGTSLRYELSGGGPSTLVLIHEMGGTLDSWDQGLSGLNNGRQVLRYDTRGAGLSEKINGSVTWNTGTTFWVDLTHCVFRLLLPLSIVGGLILAAGGVIDNFATYHTVTTLSGAHQTIVSGGHRMGQAA